MQKQLAQHTRGGRLLGRQWSEGRRWDGSAAGSKSLGNGRLKLYSWLHQTSHATPSKLLHCSGQLLRAAHLQQLWEQTQSVGGHRYRQHSHGCLL